MMPFFVPPNPFSCLLSDLAHEARVKSAADRDTTEAFELVLEKSMVMTDRERL